MKVLITGGSGFLGLHLTRYFHKKKYQISIIDIQEYPEDEYPKNINFIHGDIRDNKAVAKAMRGVDLVIHAAAALPLWKAEDIYTTNMVRKIFYLRVKEQRYARLSTSLQPQSMAFQRSIQFSRQTQFMV